MLRRKRELRRKGGQPFSQRVLDEGVWNRVRLFREIGPYLVYRYPLIGPLPWVIRDQPAGSRSKQGHRLRIAATFVYVGGSFSASVMMHAFPLTYLLVMWLLLVVRLLSSIGRMAAYWRHQSVDPLAVVL